LGCGRRVADHDVTQGERRHADPRVIRAVRGGERNRAELIRRRTVWAVINHNYLDRSKEREKTDDSAVSLDCETHHGTFEPQPDDRASQRYLDDERNLAARVAA
jgi:hypothetical protein